MVRGTVAILPSTSGPAALSGAEPAGVRGGEGAGLNGFERQMVGVFSDLVVLLGLPKSIGEIYGFIFASVEPPTFADIEQKLDLSKGSVSQGLRALRELGAIRDVAQQGDGGGESGSAASGARVTRWVATTELRQLLGTLLRERLTPYLQRQDQRMEAAESALEAEASRLSVADYKRLRARLEKLQTWQSRARTVLPVIGKML